MSTDTSLPNDNPVDPDTEQLVAYLDGELHGDERDAIEQRLLDDEKLRIQLQQLQAGWDWLDQLPNPAHDEKLVETTLELVVSDLERRSPNSESGPSRFRGPLLVFAAGLVAAGVAFATIHFGKKSRVTQDLADLAVVENLNAYKFGDDSKLMRDLVGNPSFNSMISRIEELRGSQIAASELISNTSVDDRPETVASLSVDQRASLESRWDEFKRLPPDAKEKLRATAQSVQSQPDKEHLLNTMVFYANWCENSLTAELRDKIESEDPKTRRKAVEEAVELTLQKVSQGSGRLLDDETIDRIYPVLESLFETRVVDDPKLARRLDTEFPAMTSLLRIRYMYRMLNIKKPHSKTPQFMRTRSQTFVRPISTEELLSITADLDDQALDDLRLFSNYSPFFGSDPELEEMTLLAWAEETLIRKAASMEPDKDSPIEFYMKLDEKERAYIDLLSPEEFKNYISQSRRSPSFMGGGLGSRRPPVR